MNNDDTMTVKGEGVRLMNNKSIINAEWVWVVLNNNECQYWMNNE